MKARVFSVFFSLLLAVGACCVLAYAQTEENLCCESISLADVQLEDSSSLLQGYLDQQLADIADTSSNSLSFSAAYANWGAEDEVLTDEEYAIYLSLKNSIAEVAAGSQSSTTFAVDLSFHYTTEELSEAIAAGSTLVEAAQAAAEENMQRILNCLLVDCPYELYWFDKTAGFGYGASISYSGNTVAFTIKTVTLSVASAYQGDDAHTVSSSKIAAVNTALENIRAIVAEYADQTDLAKLTAYKTEICALTAYNTEAATSTVDYGDPWQLIYVFDGDSSTNVVCEGYSKAFQYLCDLGLSDAVCYTVTGTMTSGSGSGGAHMWNIVKLCGRYYLADITNSDSGTVGQDGGLFMVDANDAYSYTEGSQYTFKVSNTAITFIYDSDTLSLYNSKVLSLSTGSSYTHSCSVYIITTVPTCTTTGVQTGTCTGCGESIIQSISATGHSYSGVVTAATCTEQGYTTYTCATCGDSYTGDYTSATGIHSYTGVVTAPTCTEQGYTTYTCTCGDSYVSDYTSAAGHSYTNSTAVTNLATGIETTTSTCSSCGDIKTDTCSVTVSVTLSTSSYTYDGSAKKPTPTVVVNGVTLTKGTDYTVSYSDNKAIGTATVTITGTGNYKGTATATFTIKPAAPTISSADSTSTGIKVTWDAVDGAEKYYVYRMAEDESSYTYVKSTTSTSWTDTSVTGGVKYSYKVKAVASGIKSSYSNAKARTFSAPTTISATSNTSSGIKVTWSSVTGAAKYYVYRKSSSESSYTYVKTTTSTSWTDTTASAGTTYTYKVKAVTSSGSVSVYSNYSSIRRLTKTTVTDTNVSSGVKVSWTKVTGASGYYVYRKTSSDSSYTKIKTISSGSTLTYTDTSVESKNGTTYTYKVVAYYKNSSGTVSSTSAAATKTIRRLTGTTLSSVASSSSGKMTVKWSKGSKITGYQIQYSTDSSFSSYKTVKVTSASTVSKTISSLTKGSKYYVRIRTYYTTSGGTTYYSAWSSKKSVTISK